MHSSPSKTNGRSYEHGQRQPRRQRRRGVLLINLGSPDSPDVAAVRRYLEEFLTDPAVIRLPSGLGWLNGLLGRAIARFRAPVSTEMYRRIWTAQGSPLEVISREQAAALEASLPDGWRVFRAMRYGRPSISEVLHEIESADIKELVVLPMYPQFSGPTTATALRELFRCLRRTGFRLDVTTRGVWYDDGAYIHAQAKLIYEFAKGRALTPNDTYLLFSAHGLPTSYAERGDPYPRHVQRTVDLVVEHLGWPRDRTSLAYQSRFGPAKWLKPATDVVLEKKARSGEENILVCPISFTADCLETLEEIGLRYRELTVKHGSTLHLCPALNAFEPFIDALKDLVLRGPSPVTSWSGDIKPLLGGEEEAVGDADLDALVMVGTSLVGRIGPGLGPLIAHAEPDRFRAVKRSQCEMPDLLRTLCSRAPVREAWVLNTCNRFEFYGWLQNPADAESRRQVVAQARRMLFSNIRCAENPFSAPAGGPRRDSRSSDDVNVLFGADAWHHLLRTAAGLNSQLPGEHEIMEQLEAAHRLAECAGTGGPYSRRLLAEVQATVRALRAQTPWGRFEPDYCFAALSRTAPQARLDLPACRFVVVGGSTTSAGVLRTLIGRFEVPRHRLTLLYRGHKRGGHIKVLRRALGNGRRVRVQAYTDAPVLQTIAGADVLIFGIDSEQPVLDAKHLRGCRDFTERPLTVIDFNTFPSTRDLEDIDGVRVFTAAQLAREVAAFADEWCDTEEFARAVEAAEAWILCAVYGVEIEPEGSQRRRLDKLEPLTGSHMR